MPVTYTKKQIAQGKKPLFRWTLGNPSKLGFEVFQESVRSTIFSLGADKFDWVVCYNSLDGAGIELLYKMVDKMPVMLFEQSIEDCPFPLSGNLRSLWKICPPRLRISTHEIIMDNDIVIFNNMPEVDQFLCDSKILYMKDKIRFFERYGDYLPAEETYNSGFIGLPPRYNFEKKLHHNWEKYGKYNDLGYGDEQGLIGLTLMSERKTIIEKEVLMQLFPDEDTPPSCANTVGYHFVVSNRLNFHKGWSYYKNLKSSLIKIL